MRISVRSEQMGGVACIRGLRIPVATVVEMVADGMSREKILGAYPDLDAEDIDETRRFAAEDDAIVDRARREVRGVVSVDTASGRSLRCGTSMSRGSRCFVVGQSIATPSAPSWEEGSRRFESGVGWIAAPRMRGGVDRTRAGLGSRAPRPETDHFTVTKPYMLDSWGRQ